MGHPQKLEGVVLEGGWRKGAVVHVEYLRGKRVLLLEGLDGLAPRDLRELAAQAVDLCSELGVEYGVFRLVARDLQLALAEGDEGVLDAGDEQLLVGELPRVELAKVVEERAWEGPSECGRESVHGHGERGEEDPLEGVDEEPGGFGDLLLDGAHALEGAIGLKDDQKGREEDPHVDPLGVVMLGDLVDDVGEVVEARQESLAPHDGRLVAEEGDEVLVAEKKEGVHFRSRD